MDTEEKASSLGCNELHRGTEHPFFYAWDERINFYLKRTSTARKILKTTVATLLSDENQ